MLNDQSTTLHKELYARMLIFATFGSKLNIFWIVGRITPAIQIYHLRLWKIFPILIINQE